jgi:hypothetical protein
MPLKVRIKPEGKLFVSGTGYLKIAGSRPMDVIVSEGLDVDREKRMRELNDKIAGLQDE